MKQVRISTERVVSPAVATRLRSGFATIRRAPGSKGGNKYGKNPSHTRGRRSVTNTTTTTTTTHYRPPRVAFIAPFIPRPPPSTAPFRGAKITGYLASKLTNSARKQKKHIVSGYAPCPGSNKNIKPAFEVGYYAKLVAPATITDAEGGIYTTRPDGQQYIVETIHTYKRGNRQVVYRAVRHTWEDCGATAPLNKEIVAFKQQLPPPPTTTPALTKSQFYIFLAGIKLPKDFKRRMARNFDRAQAMGKTDPGPGKGQAKLAFGKFVKKFIKKFMGKKPNSDKEGVYDSNTRITATTPQSAKQAPSARIAIINNPGVTMQAVVAFLVYNGKVLLATRGTDTSDVEMMGTLAGIGGKVDVGEDLGAALTREVEEEIGLDITSCDALQYYTSQVGTTYVAHFVVYLTSEPNLKISEKEKNKVVNPQWYDGNKLPMGQISATVKVALDHLVPLITRSYLYNAVSAFDKKWVDRNLNIVPPNFDIDFVNNYDSLCTAYVVDRQLPDHDKLDMVAAAANRPKEGWSPDTLLKSQNKNYTVGVFDIEQRTWLVGSPESDILCLRSPNSDFYHMDGLLRRPTGNVPCDRVVYPNGRCAASSGVKPEDEETENDNKKEEQQQKEESGSGSNTHTEDKNTTSIEGRQVASSSIKNNNDGLTEKFNALNTKNRNNVIEKVRNNLISSANPLATNIVPNGIYSGLAAANAVNDVVGGIYVTPARDLINIAQEEINTVVKIDSDEEIYLGFENYQSIGSVSPDEGLIAIGRMLVDTSLRDTINVTVNAECMTLGVQTNIHTDTGDLTVHHMMDLARTKDQRHSYRLTPNVQPISTPTGYHELVREVRDLWPLANQHNVPNQIANLLQTQGDMGTGGLFIWYTRILSGMLALQTGGARSGRAAVANRNVLFPEAAGYFYLFSGSVLPNAAGVVQQAPANPGMPAFGPNRQTGIAGACLLPLRRFEDITTPPVVNGGGVNRDWTVVLANLHLPYMLLTQNAQFTTAANPEEVRSVFLDIHGGELPPIVFLIAGHAPPQLPAYNEAALLNVDSWLDCAVALLQLFGESENFLAAIQEVTRISGRFISPVVHSLPVTPSEKYTDGRLLTDIIIRRIKYMRTVIDAPGAGKWTHVNARQEYSNVFIKAHALKHAGASHRIDDIEHNNNGALARIRSIFPGVDHTHFVWLQNHANITTGFEADIHWLQFFTEYEMASMNDHNFLDALQALTNHEMANVRMWLHCDFETTWQINAEMQALGFQFNLVEAGRNTADQIHVDADKMRDLCNGGYHYRRDLSLNVLNIQERRHLVIPAGLTKMNQVRLGVSVFHSDVQALFIASRLRNIGAESVLSTFVNLATIWRSICDKVTDEGMLSRSTLQGRQGVMIVGNQELDVHLNRTNARQAFTGEQQLIEQYVDAISQNLQKAGFPTSLTREYTDRVTTFNFMNVMQYDYEVHNGIWLGYLPTMKLVALHPAIRNLYSTEPNSGRTGTYSAKLNFMYHHMNGAGVPWSNWRINPSVTQNAAMTYFRSMAANAGYRIRIDAVVLERTTVGTTNIQQWSIGGNVLSRAPRRPDAIAYASNTRMDFLDVFAPLTAYHITPIRVGGIETWLEATVVTDMLNNPRQSAFPPVRPYFRMNKLDDIRPRFINYLPIYGFDNDAGLPANNDYVGGVHSGPGVQFIDADSERTDYGTAAIGWHRASTSNYIYRRGITGWNEINDNTRDTISGETITYVDGTPVNRAGYFLYFGRLQRNMAHAVFTHLPSRPGVNNIAARTRLESEMQFYMYLLPAWKAMFYENSIHIKTRRLPANIGKLTGVGEMDHSTRMAQHFTGVDLVHAMAADAYVVREPRTADLQSKDVTTQPFLTTSLPVHTVDTTAYPLQHFMPAYNALEQRHLPGITGPNPYTATNMTDLVGALVQHQFLADAIAAESARTHKHITGLNSLERDLTNKILNKTPAQGAIPPIKTQKQEKKIQVGTGIKPTTNFDLGF